MAPGLHFHSVAVRHDLRSSHRTDEKATIKSGAARHMTYGSRRHSRQSERESRGSSRARGHAIRAGAYEREMEEGFMVAEKARRRAGFQDGVWIRMADGQEWLFKNPPVPGVDAEYDGLVQGLLEAEDQHEARKFELAIALLLLSKNYQPSPREYQDIFCFDGSDEAQSSATKAISTLIFSDLERRRRHVAGERPAAAVQFPRLGTLPAFISNCATHFRSTMAPWLH
jgi:hypothetical protein